MPSFNIGDRVRIIPTAIGLSGSPRGDFFQVGCVATIVKLGIDDCRIRFDMADPCNSGVDVRSDSGLKEFPEWWAHHEELELIKPSRKEKMKDKAPEMYALLTTLVDAVHLMDFDSKVRNLLKEIDGE